MVFSDLNILPQSGVQDTTKGIVAFILMIFGVVMIVIAIAGFNYRRMFRTDEVIEVLPRQQLDQDSSVVVVGQRNPYL
jgi:nitrate reductase gamma subunit